MMKTVKTSELAGAALDWAVAKCEGFYADGFAIVRIWNGRVTKIIPGDYETREVYTSYSPSTNWAQGGPILQRHISELIDCGESGWEACCNGTYGATGNTALEAVCKAYVASKLGNEVEIPEELL